MESRQPPWRAAPATKPNAGDRVRYDLEIESVGSCVYAQIHLPRGPVPLSSMLPIFQRFTDIAVDVARRDEEAKGNTVSCSGTCTSCCRRLVPVSESEARYLVRLIELLPADRIETLRERFDEAVDELSRLGLLERLRESAGNTDTAALIELAESYIEANVPCPFLEDGCCSIYEHRPLSCRERATIRPVEEVDSTVPPHSGADRLSLPARPSHALLRLERNEPERDPRWLPPILLLEWARAHDGNGDRWCRAVSHFEDFLRELVFHADAPQSELAVSVLESR